MASLVKKLTSGSHTIFPITHTDAIKVSTSVSSTPITLSDYLSTISGGSLYNGVQNNTVLFTLSAGTYNGGSQSITVSGNSTINIPTSGDHISYSSGTVSAALNDLYERCIFYPLSQVPDPQTQEYSIDEGQPGNILVSDAPNGVAWASTIDANKSILDDSNLNSGVLYPISGGTSVQDAIELIDAFIGDSVNWDDNNSQYKTQQAVKNIVKALDDPTYSQS